MYIFVNENHTSFNINENMLSCILGFACVLGSAPRTVLL